MDAADFAFLAEMLRRRSGLLLTQDKRHLIENRLGRVMHRFGFRNIEALLRELRHGRDPLARAVTEAMTTNDSSFFRDSAGFEQFRDCVLPPLLVRRGAAKRLRIWSAACAAGQEVYSIAMILEDYKLAAQGWTIDLIASDLNGELIAKAQEGLYTQFEIQRGLPTRRLVRHFTQEGPDWRISENLRRMIAFRQFNLLDSFGWLDDLDVVFCRNVLMYLDHKTKVGVIDKIAEVLVPGGSLLLGPFETAIGLSDAFAPAPGMPGLYTKTKGTPVLMSATG